MACHWKTSPLTSVAVPKAVNFGLIYGMSAFGLAKQLNVTRGLAQEYINLYFARYPGVANYMETTKEDAKQNGYVATLMGRRLYLPDINARNGPIASVRRTYQLSMRPCKVPPPILLKRR